MHDTRSIDRVDIDRLRRAVDPSRAWLLDLLVGNEHRDGPRAQIATPPALSATPAGVDSDRECPGDCRLDHEYR